MGWSQALAAILTIIMEVVKLYAKSSEKADAKELELKKKKTEALQSGLRAVADRDPSRLTSVLVDLSRLRHET